MGAGSNTTTTIVCTHAAEINSTQTNTITTEETKKTSTNGPNEDNEFDTKITTISTNKVGEIVEQISELPSHEAELQKLREIGSHTPILPSEIGTDFNFKRVIVWKNVLGFMLLHFVGFVGIMLMIFCVPDYKTTIYSKFLFFYTFISLS